MELRDIVDTYKNCEPSLPVDVSNDNATPHHHTLTTDVDMASLSGTLPHEFVRKVQQGGIIVTGNVASLMLELVIVRRVHADNATASLSTDSLLTARGF